MTPHSMAVWFFSSCTGGEEVELTSTGLGALLRMDGQGRGGQGAVGMVSYGTQVWPGKEAVPAEPGLHVVLGSAGGGVGWATRDQLERL